MVEASDALKEEIEAFEAQIDELEKHHKGKYALFKDGKLVDTFSNDREAYEEGIKQFGTEIFLGRRVVKQEDPATIPALFAGVIHAHP